MAEGTELGKAYVQIIPSAQGIGAKLREALGDEPAKAGEAAGQSMGGRMMDMVKKAIAAAGIGAAFSKALGEGAALEQSLGGVETLFGESADTVIKNAQRAYQTAGVSANSYMEQVTSFSATLLQGLGGDTAAAARYADQALVQMADNANKMGTDMTSIQMAYQGFAKDNYTMLDNLKLGYGGTQSEMARLINESGVLGDAVTVTAETVKDVPFDKIIEAIGVVQDELGITGTTAEEAATTLSGSLGAMKAAFANVLGGLTLGQDITPALEGLAETVTAFLFDNLLPAVGNILKGLPEAVWTALQNAAPQISEKISELLHGINPELGGMWDSLSAGVAQAMPGIQSALAGFVSWVQEHADTLIPLLASVFAGFKVFSTLSGIAAKLTPVITAVTGLTGKLKAADSVLGAVKAVVAALGGPVTLIIAGVAALTAGFLYLWNTCEPFKQFWLDLGANISAFVQGAVESVVNFFTVTLPATVQNAITFLQGIPGAIAAFFQQLPYNIGLFLGQALGHLLSWAIQLPGLAMQAASDFLTNAVTFFSQLPGNLLTWTTEALTNLGQWALDLGQKGLEAAEELLNNVVDGITELPGELLDIGQQAVEGLWNGIKGAGEWLSEQISGFVRGIVDGFTSSFKIGSPSRVMADEVGRWIAPGIAEGITGNLRPLSAAMGEVKDSLTQQLSGVQGRLTAALRLDLAEPLPRGAQAAGSVQNIYFEQPMQAPDEIARALRIQQTYGLAGAR